MRSCSRASIDSIGSKDGSPHGMTRWSSPLYDLSDSWHEVDFNMRCAYFILNLLGCGGEYRCSFKHLSWDYSILNWGRGSGYRYSFRSIVLCQERQAALADKWRKWIPVHTAKKFAQWSIQSVLPFMILLCFDSLSGTYVDLILLSKFLCTVYYIVVTSYVCIVLKLEWSLLNFFGFLMFQKELTISRLSRLKNIASRINKDVPLDNFPKVF